MDYKAPLTTCIGSSTVLGALSGAAVEQDSWDSWALHVINCDQRPSGVPPEVNIQMN